MITRHRGHAAAALLLAGFALILFARLLFTDRVLANGDILHYFYPYRDYAAAALREGRIPLWNPYIFSGAPFLANPQAAVLYPLHWPLSWLPVTKQLYWSAAIHTWILGLGGYALMRRLGGGWAAGMATGLVLAGSGFYGGLLGHINQMNGAAWLPWLVWTVTERQKAKGGRQKERVCEIGTMSDPHFVTRNSQFAIRTCFFALFVSLSLLAGHTQTAYINLFGVGAMIVGLGILNRRQTADGGRQMAQSPIPNPLTFALLVFIAGTLLGLLLSAAQLLPSLELSGLGLRGGGLSYQEVTSFSLRPLLLHWTLLPSYGLWDLGVVFGTLGYTEFVASIGAIGLLLAGAGFWRGRGSRLWWMGVGFAALGLLLALGRWNPVYYPLYKIVPGFDLFRTPARWMMLYTLGVALLAGVGIGERGSGRGPSAVRRLWYVVYPVALLLLSADLILSARALPHTHPTASQAVYDVRTAPAHLLTDPERSQHPAVMGRFLSMSTITFDPGDMADWRRIFRENAPPQLDEAAFREFVIALKAQEILAPNLPLLWRIPAADGFDGGVLPLERYNRFLTLFIPPEQLVPDGRLREQVRRIPPAPLLDLMDIRYVITDKVEDLWFEGVYYDRQIGARLSADGVMEINVAVDRPFQATQIRIIGALAGETGALAAIAQPLIAVEAMVDGASVPVAALTGGGGAGAHLADQRLDSPLAVTSDAQIAFRDVERERQEYLAQLPLLLPTAPDALRLSLLPDAPPGMTVVVQAITLFDERTGTFIPLLPSDRGDFRLVHSGDVKIYERLTRPGRATLVTFAQAAKDDDGALIQLLAAAGGQTVVEADPATVAEWGLTGGAAGTVRLHSYAPERIVVKTQSDAPALLVLRDAFYPGWRATVDGAPAPIYPVDVLFRGVALPAGQHEIVFVYDPPFWRWGLALSGVGVVLWLLLLIWGWSSRRAGGPVV